jgi:hypothetical protein
MPSPNPIKYTAGATAADTIKKGNFVLGVTNKDYAPTSSTEFWNGITPPTTSGYTVYQYKAANGPSIRCANNDSELVNIAKGSGCTGSTIVDALTWFATGPNFVVTNITDYPAIVTNGLVTLIDAGSTVSYPRGNNTIYDAVNNVNNGTLINGTSFSATGGTGGSLYFDGVDDYVDIGAVTTLTTFSIDVWFYALTNTGPAYYPLVASFANYLAAYASGSGFLATFPSTATSSGGFSFNTWNNVVFTYDTNTQNGIFYINGVYDSTTASFAGQSYNGSKYLGVRYAGDGQIIKGNIGVVKVYSRAITASEVTQNYNAMKVRYV